MNEIIFTIPINLDFDRLFRSTELSSFTFPQNIDTVLGRQKLKDKLAYIIDSILMGMARRDEDFLDKYDDSSPFIPLYSPILKDNLGDGYLAYFEYLERAEVIVCNNIYSKGHSSYGFAIRSPYIGVDVKSHKVEDRVLSRKLLDFYTLYIDYINEFELENGEILKIKDDVPDAFLNTLKQFITKVSFDGTKAISKLQELQKAEELIIGQDKSLIKYQKRLIPVHKLTNKQFYITRDATGRRVHTNISALKRELRQYLTFDNKKLVEVDIVNSQPYFFNALLNPSFYTKENPVYFSLLSRLEFDKSVCKTLVESSAQDKLKYIDATSKGNFYEIMQQVLAEKFGREVSRQESKQYVFPIFFARNRYNSNIVTIGKEAFAEAFPTLATLMGELKRVRHNSCAILLQRIESYLMLDKVTERIIRELPEHPIFTIHDSFLCLEEDVEQIKKIMEEEIVSFTNIPITIKAK